MFDESSSLSLEDKVFDDDEEEEDDDDDDDHLPERTAKRMSIGNCKRTINAMSSLLKPFSINFRAAMASVATNPTLANSNTPISSFMFGNLMTENIF